MSERCELTDLLTDQCSHCRGLDKVKPRSLAERVIVAQYSNRCPSCGSWVSEGENIGLIDGEWVCDGCFTIDLPGVM